MNTVVEMVDKIRDTAQSHDRCSIVEVMGRGAGYIALNTGIAVGAIAVVIPEKTITTDEIVERIEKSRASGKQHYIIVVSEAIGNSEALAKEIQERTGIESRATILGHVQRGGSPTLRDRVAASRMGAYAVDLLEKGIGNRVVGMNRDEVIDVDIQEALSMKKPFPIDLYELSNKISF